MKTVQKWLKEVDKEELIGTYLYNYPINIFNLKEKAEKFTIEEVKKKSRKIIEEYIDRLINLEVEPSDDGDQYILFAYNVFMEDFENVDYALVSKKELLESDLDEKVCQSYGFMLSNQEEIMGYLVADTKLTKDNIYGLLVYVLYEASWFGYKNENLEEEKQKLEEATKEIEEGKYSSFTIEDMREEFGLPKKEQDEKQEELLKKIFHTIFDFSQYSFKKEARRVKKEVVKGLNHSLEEKLDKLENELEKINKDLDLTIKVLEEEMEEE